MEKKIIFIGGLHRSGTSSLYKLLGSDKRISIFEKTGVIEDEGQFLQSVYLRDNELGGPGAFAFHPKSHLTENNNLNEVEKSKLFNQWSKYWILDCEILAEKSPANILKSRFLQNTFPNSSFIFIIRHPIATALATSKWNRAYLNNHIKHWIKAHQIMLGDLKLLNNSLILKYEDFTKNPENYKSEFSKILGFEPIFDWKIIKPGLNVKYFNKWEKGDFYLDVPKWKRGLKRLRNLIEIKYIIFKYEKEINKFGYSFKKLSD